MHLGWMWAFKKQHGYRNFYFAIAISSRDPGRDTGRKAAESLQMEGDGRETNSKLLPFLIYLCLSCCKQSSEIPTQPRFQSARLLSTHFYITLWQLDPPDKFRAFSPANDCRWWCLFWCSSRIRTALTIFKIL